MIKTIKCPLCFSRDKIKLKFVGKDYCEKIIDREFNLYECKNCGAIFIYPIPSKAEIPTFYPKDYYSYKNNDKKSFLTKLREKIIRSYYESLRKESIFWKIMCLFFRKKYKNVLPTKLVKNGSFLDIGCGTGANLEILRDYGWDTYGLEIDANIVKKAKEKNLNIKLATLEEYEIDKKFDCIRIWHVLEHLPDPHTAIKKLSALLKNNGEIFMAVPNTRSLNAFLFGKYWVGYDVPRHIINYSLNSLENILLKSNLKIEEVNYATTTGLIESISNLLNSKFKRKFRLHNNLFFVIISFPYSLLTDLLRIGDIIYLRITKRI